MATVTIEPEVVAECATCTGEMTVAPVLHGIELAGRYICDVCYFYKFDGSKAKVLAHLGLGPRHAGTGPADGDTPDGGDGDGDDGGPDGGPGPAAPSARPTLWLLVAGTWAPRELTPAEEGELDAFIEATRASAPNPEPCTRCSRPASPYTETASGPLCLACADTEADGEGGERCWACDVPCEPAARLPRLPGNRPVCLPCTRRAKRSGEWALWAARCRRLDGAIALAELD